MIARRGHMSNKRRELFGNASGTNGAKRQHGPRDYQQNQADIIRRQNDANVDILDERVAAIHRQAQEISILIGDTTQDTQALSGSVVNAKDIVKSLLGKLEDLSQSGSNKLMLYMVLFVVGVFLLIYFLMTYTSRS
mmetsp:Transcript_13290/g.14727  ORF Transcript_13290/g.14727 Transcript_13290/m.14727 type:complete len:136 (+) Transcript_13290:22-429(+)